MADLATEPRWARIVGTFGEDADLVGRLTAAYIRGFQGETLGPHSVACMLKHFPGGGPQKDGEDPHFAYGREQVYPGDNLEYHLQPFAAALDAGAAQVMPYYGMPVGTPFEEVGFGFNRDVVTGLLRTRFGFDGVVCADWSLLTDIRGADGEVMIDAKAWGVEDLSVPERLAKAIDAGVDQFGGEECTDVLLALVRSGRISEARLDESARRLLRDKFRLGLFDDPFVDPDAAERTVGRADFREAGERAQRRAITLLQNDGGVLPLRQGARIYVEGVDAEVAAGYGEVVTDPAAAEVAILRRGRAVRAARGVPRAVLPGRLARVPRRAAGADPRPARPGADGGRRVPRPAGGDPGDRREGRRAAGRLRRERRGRPGRGLRPARADRAAAVRAAVVDRGGRGPEAGRAARLGAPALPVRARPDVRPAAGHVAGLPPQVQG